MAAILDYLAEAKKITNFLIVAPGKIIREKTINNFSLNKPNSLVDTAHYFLKKIFQKRNLPKLSFLNPENVVIVRKEKV